MSPQDEVHSAVRTSTLAGVTSPIRRSAVVRYPAQTAGLRRGWRSDTLPVSPGSPITSAKETHTSIAGRAAAGVAWNFATGLSVKALGLGGTLLLTRFLGPGDFGDVWAAVIVVDTATRFADYNLGNYVVTRQTDPNLTFQAFVYHVGAMASACLVVTLFRHPIASALGSPGVAAYVPWLALARVLLQISRIPESTLYRALRFRTLALIRAGGDVAYTVVSVLLAPVLGGATVVAGNLARAATLTGTILARSNRSEWLQPGALRLSAARDMVSFGFPLSAKSLVDNLSSSWDNLLVSRFFGNQVMGQYRLAYNLADITGLVTDAMSDVLLPSLARLDLFRQRLALPRIAAMMGLVIFPLITGLALVAPLAVTALLAPQWAGVAPLLTILCFKSVPVPFDAVFASYFAARGRTTVMMCLGMAKLALVLGFLLTLGQLGPRWACFAVVLAFHLSSVLALLAGWRLEQLSPGPLIAATLRPLAASALMAAAVLLFRITMARWMPMPVWLDLALEVTVGAFAYVGAAFLVARPTAIAFIDVARGLVFRKAAQ